MSVCSDRDAENSRQAQVCYLEAGHVWVGVIYQQVAGLQVSVHHAAAVQVGNTLQQLVHEHLRSINVPQVRLIDLRTHGVPLLHA